MLIQEKAYRLTEKKLRRRYTLVAEAEQNLYEIQLWVTSVTGVPLDKIFVLSSVSSSRTEMAARRLLEAERKLENARKWEDVFRECDRAFPIGTMVRRVVDLIYDNGKTQKQAEMELKISENTAQKYKETYICHAAMFAASKGLIKLWEDGTA